MPILTKEIPEDPRVQICEGVLYFDGSPSFFLERGEIPTAYVGNHSGCFGRGAEKEVGGFGERLKSKWGYPANICFDPSVLQFEEESGASMKRGPQRPFLRSDPADVEIRDRGL